MDDEKPLDTQEEKPLDTPEDYPDIVITWTPNGLSAQVDSRLYPDQVAGAAWLLEHLAEMMFSSNLAQQANQSGLVRAAAMPMDHLPPRKRN